MIYHHRFPIFGSIYLFKFNSLGIENLKTSKIAFTFLIMCIHTWYNNIVKQEQLQKILLLLLGLARSIEGTPIWIFLFFSFLFLFPNKKKISKSISCITLFYLQTDYISWCRVRGTQFLNTSHKRHWISTVVGWKGNRYDRWKQLALFHIQEEKK